MEELFRESSSKNHRAIVVVESSSSSSSSLSRDQEIELELEDQNQEETEEEQQQLDDSRLTRWCKRYGTRLGVLVWVLVVGYFVLFDRLLLLFDTSYCSDDDDNDNNNDDNNNRDREGRLCFEFETTPNATNTTEPTFQYSYKSRPDRISLAAVAIWAFLIPKLYLEYAQFKLSLDRQRTARTDDGNTTDHNTADRALARWFYGTLAAGLGLYLGTAFVVCSETAEGMDRRATDMVAGLSRVFVAVLGLVLSVEFCQWIGVYGSVPIDHWGRYRGLLDNTDVNVNANVNVNVNANANANEINETEDDEREEWSDNSDSNSNNNISKSNSNKDNHKNYNYNYYYHYTSHRTLTIDFSLALWHRLLSTFWFHLYCSCSNTPRAVLRGTLGVGIPLGIGLLLLVHAIRTHPRLRPHKRGIAVCGALVVALVTAVCVGYGVLAIGMVWNEDLTQLTGGERGMVAVGVVASVRTAAWVAAGLWAVLVCGGVHGAFAVATIGSRRRPTEPPTSVALSSSSSSSEPTLPPKAPPLVSQYTSDHFREGAPGIDAQQARHQLFKLFGTPTNTNTGPECEYVGVGVGDSDGDVDGECDDDTEHGVGVGVVDANENENKDNNGNDNDITSSTGSKKKDHSPHHTQGTERHPPSYCWLIPSRLCERYRRKTQSFWTVSSSSSSSSSLWRKTGRIARDTVWWVATLLVLYLTVLNIGATRQQNVVRLRLDDSFAQLYPNNYHTGQMCAWSATSPSGHIRTFDTLREVEDTAGNYTVIHCGACGACSNWDDLSLQWTTRTFLAQASKQCCRTSILGTLEDVQRCNEERIGFSPKCAACWTEDELCARDNCFWIFLQSQTIHAETDFRVGLNDITAATCDEALCGPRFVPCVGAIRRRMNIQSDIERPIAQQCLPVQEDWSAIFDLDDQ